MTFASFAAAAPDPALETLFVPFATGAVTLPERVLFLHARAGFRLREMAGPGWLCEQSFKPFADALIHSGFRVGEPDDDAHFDLVMVLPPRQRDEARALFARAVRHAMPGGRVLTSVPNAQGARSAQADLTKLVGLGGQLSKHKCRVFWTPPLGEGVEHERLAQWLALNRPRSNDAGFVSRPGLFAWDRVDPASALLIAHVPRDLHGRVADLGAGYGYLSTQVIARCPRVTAIDLYEADARALEPARINLAKAVRGSGREVAIEVHWHDVTGGLPRCYEVIISNPPFHQGRADLPDLGRAFIASAAAGLKANGRLFIVANRHLPYEATLAAHFAQVRTLIEQGGFKVIEASAVRDEASQ